MSSGAAALPADLPLPGDVVAGYFRVESVLGSGGMGVVLAAIDQRTNAPVAVKLLRSGHEQRQVERFFREARTMGRLSTPHVVRVFEAGGEKDKPFLVMERLDGLDLAALTKQRGVLPPVEVADCMIQACEALSHAHAAGIVHRDVKPSNLFLHEEPASGRKVLKVLDFGISKVIARDAFEHTLTSSTDGGVLGSPPYMSPEQVRDPRTVDPRTDVWSLGVVMYKLMAGRLPFDGDSVGEVFARVLERRYPSLLNTVDVPKEIDAIVAKCLAKDRRERFAHVGELAVALAPFASPGIAALAQPIFDRLRDEARTVDFSDASGPSLGVGPDARTLTVDDSRYISAPPPRISQTPSRLGSEVPTGAGAASASINPPPPAGRSWIAFALLGLGIAAGVLIGFGVQRQRPTTGRQEIEAAPASAPASAPAPASASASASAPAAAPASASASATATATPTPTATAAGKPVGGKGGKRTGTGTGTGSSATGRPELQPSPYGTN